MSKKVAHYVIADAEKEEKTEDPVALKMMQNHVISSLGDDKSGRKKVRDDFMWLLMLRIMETFL